MRVCYLLSSFDWCPGSSEEKVAAVGGDVADAALAEQRRALEQLFAVDMDAYDADSDGQ